VTEIPEHLLKRSRERRSAIGHGGDAAGAGDGATPDTPSASPATTTAATPAVAASTGPVGRSAAPAPEAVAKPKPDPIYVTAAKQRRKVPWWAMATLGLMPVWGFMYWRALTEPAEVVEGPLGVGAEVYGGCASCHGAAGGGGLGYAFSGGEVLKTFPNIQDQLRYVYFGTTGYNLAGVEIYGNPDREGGAHITGARNVMPAQGGGLTDAEILGVVCHERYALGGADPLDEVYAEEFERWCSEESPIFEELEAGSITLIDEEFETFVGADGTEFDVAPVGPEPIEGSAAAAE
jgi:mono/diheme cytochrome c family protein